MSCRHGWHDWHGCGPCDYGPDDRGWYGPGGWYEDVEWPRSRRYRRPLPAEPEVTEANLEARLQELTDTVREVAAELAALRGSAREKTGA